MSEIKAIEKLRDTAKIGGRLWLSNYADAIEREIAERYMPRLVDADGVPIHMGDTIEGELLYDSTVRGTVCAFHLYDDEPDSVYLHVDVSGGWTIYELRPTRCHHVKPRTVEDVLAELEGMRGDNATYEDVVARCSELACELREMLGGDAE